nr:hypothetical protein HK105_000185 [Polyrhizophydium stewartii]
MPPSTAPLSATSLPSAPLLPTPTDTYPAPGDDARHDAFSRIRDRASSVISIASTEVDAAETLLVAQKRHPYQQHLQRHPTPQLFTHAPSADRADPYAGGHEAGTPFVAPSAEAPHGYAHQQPHEASHAASGKQQWDPQQGCPHHDAMAVDVAAPSRPGAQPSSNAATVSAAACDDPENSERYADALMALASLSSSLL